MRNEKSTNIMHHRKPHVFHQVNSATRGKHVVVNDSAPLRVEFRKEMCGDIGLICLPIGKPICEIASRWPVLVYVQAGIETAYYRVWAHSDFSDLRPVEDFSRIAWTVDGNPPQLPTELSQTAFDVLQEMEENRTERANEAKKWRADE
jgi:hypothetical protein